MKQTKLFYPFYFCFFMCIASCKWDKKSSELVGKNIQDTTILDIPATNRMKSIIRAKKNAENHLKIDKLEGRFDSLQIRIWTSEAFNDTCRLVILKNEKSKWSAVVYYFHSTAYEDMDTKNNNELSPISKSPISGWNNFIDRLKSLQILTLPDYSSISGYYLHTDGDGVDIEIASPNKYRIYSYPTPEGYKKEFVEAGQILEILSLLKKELLL